MPDPLPPEYEAALRRTATRRGHFGDALYYFTETGSTNDVAAALAEQGAPDGTVVVASAQHSGRGRLGRTWYSPPGAGLYVSVVCREPRAFPYLTLAGGVAVAAGIRNATGLPVLIKWPNDVVVEQGAPARAWRKLAGVLAEASTGTEGLQSVILGMGINVRPAAYPPDLASRATSIEWELGRAVDAGTVLAEVLAELAVHVRSAAAGITGSLLACWRELAPSASGARVEWDAPGGRVAGITAGIADDGALLIRIGPRIERVISGEVNWL